MSHHKLEAERTGRVVDQKKHLEFFQRVAAQMQTQQVEILSYSLQFQRDSPIQKTEEAKAVISVAFVCGIWLIFFVNSGPFTTL